jgi:hypothetical protein
VLCSFVPAGFIPKRKFDAIPKSKFVVDEAKMVFHHVLSRSNGVGYFAVLESLGDQCDNFLLARAGFSVSIKTGCGRGRTLI